MNITTVIFDLDGTLLYTLEDLTDSVNFALNSLNYPEHSLEEIKSFVGNGISLLIERAIPNGKDNPDFKICKERFIEHYKENMFNKSAPYDDIVNVLKALKSNGYKIAILSNKHDSAVKMLTEKYFNNLIDITVGQSDTIKPKPSLDGVNFILNELNINAENCIFVGDSEVDIQTANNACMPCLSVVWGYKDIDFLYKNGASVLLFTPNEILELL